MKMKIKEAIQNKDIEFYSLYEALINQDFGNFDNVNRTEIIQEYIKDMISKGVSVFHMLKAIEDNISKYDLWEVWLGNSMETPTPINSKEELVDALGLEGEDLDLEIEI